MDFFNKGMAQITDLFRSMTPAARITAGLLLAVVVVSLTYLFNHQFTGGDAYLLGGQSFSSAELSAMEAAFGKAGLSTYSIDGGRVQVPASQKSAYLAALADNGALPAHFGDHLSDALTNFGPFTTRDEREAKLKAAKERELAGIILSMEGIEKASVQYDFEKASGFRQSSTAKASVAVKRHGVLPLDEKQVPMIRHLVAGAFAGLSAEHVTIVDLNGRSYIGSNIEGVGGSDDPFVSRMREMQTMYESQIYKALSYVPGVTVTANVELNKELRQRQEKDSYDPKAVATVMSKEETQTSNTKGGSQGGRPGLESQGANQGARLPTAATGTESTDESSVSEVQNVPSREHVSTELAGLTPKRVSVSVGIPSSYFEQIWRHNNPTPAGQEAKTPDKAELELIQKAETDKILAFVTNIIPKQADAGDQAETLVTVTTFEHVITEAGSGPPVMERAIAWLGNYWTTLGTIGLVVVSLMMLRSIMASPAAAIPDLPRLAAQTAGDATPETAAPGAEAATKPKGRFKRKLGTGPSLREELAEMVREDPDAAANILRGWIGQMN